VSNVEQFRPRNGYFLSFWIFFTISTLTYVNVLDYGFLGGLPSITWGLFACSLFYLIFLHPKVVYCDEGIVIVNPMQDITLGWDEISLIDSKFTMYVIHQSSGAKYHAFAAQAPGRYHLRNVHPTEIRGMNSGIAIAIARIRFENFHQRGNIQGLKFSTAFNRLGASIVLFLFLLAITTQLLQP
jgi:hypothetical protein